MIILLLPFSPPDCLTAPYTILVDQPLTPKVSILCVCYQQPASHSKKIALFYMLTLYLLPFFLLGSRDLQNLSASMRFRRIAQ